MLTIERRKNLAPLTTFRIGGPAEFFCTVRTLADLKEARKFAHAKNIQYRILGGGSNTLVADEGFAGLVIKMEMRGVKMKDLDYEKVLVEAGAGENWDDLVAMTVSKKLYGLENLSLIPGTVGASPVQNIGAYGAEVKDTISAVEVFDMEKDEVRVLSAEECQFGYRDSIFKHKAGAHLVITKVNFVLEKGGPQSRLGAGPRVNIGYKDLKDRFKERYSKDITPEEVRNAVVEIRKQKLPDVSKVGTAGSFFKNPIISAKEFETVRGKVQKLLPDSEMPSWSEPGGQVKVPLAWILDKVCGMKGQREGNIGTHENQPLVLVNFGGGTFEEVSRTAKRVVDSVHEKTGLAVEWEVQVIK